MYTDYQCAQCAKAAPAFEQAAKELEGTMNLTVLNFPLFEQHKNAVVAAQAVVAAEKYGKHDEMAHKLYTAQSKWQGLEKYEFTSLLDTYAKELNLNTSSFIDDMVNALSTVKEEYGQGTKRNISTKDAPSYTVNGNPIVGLSSITSTKTMVDTFKAVVDHKTT